jgi:hypothetical protein
MTTEFKDFEEVRERADELAEWIGESSADLVGEQRQLEEGSREQAYWHYGYMVALRDVLRFMADSKMREESRPDGWRRAA